MRLLLVVLLAVAVIFAVVGCGENEEMTKATKVENPKEKKAETPKPEEAAAKKEAVKEETPKPETKAEEPKPGKDGWVTTKSGLKYKGQKGRQRALRVKSGDAVIVHYKGWLDDGTVFDTSKKPGRKPLPFTVDRGDVIEGWEEGVKGMKVGGTRELNIPPDLGYGERGGGPIPPNSTLHFDVELLQINK